MTAPRGRPRGVLTEQQLRVLSLVSHGYCNREIAAEMMLAHSTVANHVRRILAELQATDRAHAVRIGFEDDLLTEARERRPRNPRRGYGARLERASGGAR